MVEHQNPSTQATCAEFETGSVGRERVSTKSPLSGVIRCWCVHVVLAVVKDDFEHPAGVFYRGHRQPTGTSPFIIQQGHAVSISNVLEITVRFASAGVASATAAFVHT